LKGINASKNFENFGRLRCRISFFY